MFAATWESGVSAIGAMQGDVRRSTPGHGARGKCEIREEFVETSRLYLAQSLQLQSQNRHGLHNQNKYSGALNLWSAQSQWDCAPAKKRDREDFQKLRRARELLANLVALRLEKWAVFLSARRCARLPRKTVLDGGTPGTEPHNRPWKFRRRLDWLGRLPLGSAFQCTEKTTATKNPRSAPYHPAR